MGAVRAVVVDQFGAQPDIQDVPEPRAATDGVIVAVRATGLCRSDWHAWVGHDPDVTLPFVPGHELAGVVLSVGADVRRWHPGDRVTVPFVCACGTCATCRAGEQQVCERQQQPGFSHDGSFAERVALRHADVNLVALPDALSFVDAAALGCRVATAWRAVVDVGQVRAGEQVLVLGCGGAGLAAVMAAVAAGATVVAVDLAQPALDLARALGAHQTFLAVDDDRFAELLVAVTGGGAHLSVDAAGSEATLALGIRSLRRRGRHVQVGLLPAASGHPQVPMDVVIARELQVLGSHGMPAHDYPRLMRAVASGRMDVGRLVQQRIRLEDVPGALGGMGTDGAVGVTVIEP